MATAIAPSRAFIGRPEAVDAIRQRVDSVRHGRGGFSLVLGDPGLGKSTLIAQIAAECAAADVTVVERRIRTHEGSAPLSFVRDLVAEVDRAVRARADAEQQGPMDSSEAVMIGFAPRAASGVLPPPWSIEERLQDAMVGVTDATEANRSRLFARLADDLVRSADLQPLVLLLEDLHLADPLSLEFLEYLASTVADHPLAVVATTVPFREVRESVRAALERLVKRARVEQVGLRPLTENEMVSFVRTLDGNRELAPEEATRWHSQTGGNPLFVEQLLKRTRDRSRGTAPPLPTSPEEVVEYDTRQLADLNDDENRTLAVASTLGREFSFQLLLAASDEKEEPLAEAIDRLVARGLLRERSDEGLEFVRDEIRQRVYSRLTEARRRLLHKRAGEAIETVEAVLPETIFALARHFDLGRVDEKSWMYHRLAGEIAANSFSPNMAREHFAAALEGHKKARPDDASGQLELTLALAVQLDRLGELKVAEALLRPLVDRPPPPGTPIDQPVLIQVYLARILSDQGQWEEAARLTERVARDIPPNLPVQPRLAIHRVRGEVLYYQARYEESLAEHDKGLALARELHEDREAALAVVRRANVLAMIPGRVEEAVAAYRLASQELVRRGDRGEAAYALLFLGITLSLVGRTEEGLKELEESLRLAEEGHDLRRMGWALFDIADLKLELGRRAEAEVANHKAREILERIGDKFGVVQTQIIEGKIRLDANDPDGAEVELLEAFRLSRELHAPADEVDALLRLAEVAVARGDLVMARSRQAELERRQAKRLRPDLARDLERLADRIPPPGPL